MIGQMGALLPSNTLPIRSSVFSKHAGAQCKLGLETQRRVLPGKTLAVARKGEANGGDKKKKNPQRKQAKGSGAQKAKVLLCLCFAFGSTPAATCKEAV